MSFRMDWLHLLAVQGTLKSRLQHHSSKASILWRSAFFIVQLSHPDMTTGKTLWESQDSNPRESCCLPFLKKKNHYFQWRLTTLQHCGGFCRTLTSISHGCATQQSHFWAYTARRAEMKETVFIAAMFTIARLFFSVPAARTQSPWWFLLPALTIPPGLFFFFAPEPALTTLLS